MNSHQKENILKNLQDKNIRFREFKNYEDYINILELLKISSKFAVSINEITDKNKEYIIDLIKNYQNTKFLFLYNQNLSINQIYEIILNGAVDVLPLNTNPELITAKIIATFRSEFRKVNLGIIKTKDNKITLDLDNLKITIEKKEYKITKKQAAILSILLSNEGRTIDRYKIASIVYCEKIEKINPQIIDKHIQLIRENIPELSSKIKNVWGVGYIYENK